jgi:glycosyltransferase involved in cell wall biosynthesis
MSIESAGGSSRDVTMIDGFSLSLSQGTGIATYSRNLAICLRNAEQKTAVLYGRPIPASAPPLLKEVGLYDEETDRPSTRLQEVLLSVSRLTSPTLTYSAYEIPLNGAVIDQQVRHRVPEGIRAWNVSNLYKRAERQFAIWRQFTTVRSDDPPRLMHWTYPLPVHMRGTRNIYTLHDLVPLRLPYTTLDHKRRYFHMVKHIAETADHISTVSECSKRDIINLLGVPEHKVTNTYQAVHIPESMRMTSDQEVAAEIQNVFGLKHRGYWLFYGALEPKKNVGRIVQAYLASGVPEPLILVGPNAWGTETKNLVKDIEDGAYGRKILRFNYVPFATLVSLIRGAKATVFPSLYEGFGLPVLESMLLGTPVISSNTSSIPEVAGNAALLVDPYDVLQIKAAFLALSANHELRGELVAKGHKQCNSFSIEKFTQRLLGLYGKVR